MYKVLNPGHIGHAPDLETTLATAKKYGFSGVAIDIAKESTRSAEELKRISQKYGQHLAEFGLPVNFRADTDIYEQDMEKLEHYARFAQECGITNCSTWIFPGSNQYTFEQNFEFHKNRLKPTAAILNKYNIRLGLEFVGTPSARAVYKYEFIHTLDGMLELCRAIQTGNVGILLDSYHWFMAGHTLKDFKKFPDESWIVSVHINDAPAGIPREKQDDLVRALPGSTGVIPIKDFFQGLLNLGYTGPVACEPFVAELAKMELDQAVSILKTAIDTVWP